MTNTSSTIELSVDFLDKAGAGLNCACCCGILERRGPDPNVCGRIGHHHVEWSFFHPTRMIAREKKSYWSDAMLTDGSQERSTKAYLEERDLSDKEWPMRSWLNDISSGSFHICKDR